MKTCMLGSVVLVSGKRRRRVGVGTNKPAKIQVDRLILIRPGSLKTDNNNVTKGRDSV